MTGALSEPNGLMVRVTEFTALSVKPVPPAIALIVSLEDTTTGAVYRVPVEQPVEPLVAGVVVVLKQITPPCAATSCTFCAPCHIPVSADMVGIEAVPVML